MTNSASASKAGVGTNFQDANLKVLRKSLTNYMRSVDYGSASGIVNEIQCSATIRASSQLVTN